MSLLGQVQSAGSSSALRYPKVLIYGGPGVGKTVTALAIAQSLDKKLLAIDGDGGTEAYLNDEYWAGIFDVVVCSEPVEVCRALDELLYDPSKWGVLLVDSISTMWRDGEYAVENAARRKHKDKNLTLYESAWNLSLWNPTKRLAWQIAANIKRLKMPIICTAREASKWSNGQVVGVKPEGDAQIAHEFDIVVRLSQFHANSPRVAEIDKDRLHRLPTRIEGKHDDPFWFALALMEAYGNEFGYAPQANPRATNQQAERLYALQSMALDKNPNLQHMQIMEWLRSTFSEDRYEDLSPEQATSAIQTFETRLGGGQEKT